MRQLSLKRGIALLLLLAVFVVVVAASVFYLFSRDSAAPVSSSEVVSRFQDNHRSASDPSDGPTPGVYRYSTSGSERVEALLTSRHDYDHASTITVTRDGSRLTERVDLLEERWTAWGFSLSSKGRRLRTLTDFHKFLGIAIRESYRCKGVWVPPLVEVSEGFTWTDRCSGRGAEAKAFGRVVGVEKLSVAGKNVETTHLRSIVRLTGRIRGTRIVDLWLLPSSELTIRRSERSDVRIARLPGKGRSRERYTMRLRSLQPLR